MPKYYIEVSTLFDLQWSGIANVTANLSRSMLRSGAEIGFFAWDQMLDPRYVAHALRRNDGAGLGLLFDYQIAVAGPLVTRTRSPDGEICIFPNFRRAGEHFDREILIVHDLSFVLMPELHEPTRVREYVENLYYDVSGVDEVVCVSHATRHDLIAYFRAPPEKVRVAHLGVEPVGRSSAREDARQLQAQGLQTGKFFLILGTIEPRKNIGLVLDFLKANPGYPTDYRFVFAGRDGWGKSFDALCGERALNDRRILRLGYVSERLKGALLRNCAALILPSWFEGFGLPVIEAMANGAPVLGSRSSSIVEVGGTNMIGFDPASLESFAAAIGRFVELGASELASLRKACREHAAQFTWDGFRDRLVGTIN